MPMTESLIADPHTLADASCDACPHPRHEHDALGVRYCTATAVSALPRGCICR